MGGKVATVKISRKLCSLCSLGLMRIGVDWGWGSEQGRGWLTGQTERLLWSRAGAGVLWTGLSRIGVS
jgi:hypothetical protein